ncbi:hypothetical protein PG5_33410 [Pseudomonas sp. G5(2012)]|nr:hypothetical protein PG5_33410 [Pseudomonas sp. G5(2012)]
MTRDNIMRRYLAYRNTAHAIASGYFCKPVGNRGHADKTAWSAKLVIYFCLIYGS